MKLLRYGPPGLEKPGLLDADGAVRDLSRFITDIGGATASLTSLQALRAIDPATLPHAAPHDRLGPCLIDAPNFFCVGLNYHSHADQADCEPPEEPVIFSKATSAIAGPDDDLRLPDGAEKCDWEVELGVVIGAPASYVREAEALDHVAGYCLVNDISERHFQAERGGQWIKGKSAPGFGPIGPWFVTADEIPDPQALEMTMTLNGETMQRASTADMIFSVAHIISYMSRFMALRPGDVIATGTPAGVGLHMRPQRFLRPGDVMRLEIAGLGAQTQHVADVSL